MNISNSKDNFVVLYENLRSQALNDVTRDTRHGLGLSLFIQRGMVVWIKSRCMCEREVTTTTEVGQIGDCGEQPPLLLSLQDEIVNVLVNMALGHQEGGFHV